MEAQKKYTYIDEFKVLKTLGSGYHAEVKLAEDNDGNLVAIKRYKKATANLSTLQHQLSIMKQLNHTNLVRLVDVREDAIEKFPDQTTESCFAIVLEYVGGGELFDYIADTGKFSEKVSRTYFHQMMSGLHHMHSKGYAHRDIKPENILLTRDFVLKLADFGFSCLIKGKDGSGILHTKLGTQGYMAPEITSKIYQGTKTDIFAAGVILFIMYAGNPPFEKAHPNDPYYKLIKGKNYDVFWKAHSRRRPVNYFSPQFQELINKMLAFEPNERYTIEQVAAHPWVKGQVCTYSQIKLEFEQRQALLDKVLQERRLEQEKKKNQQMESIRNQNSANSRGDEVEVDTAFLSEYNKEFHLQRKIPTVDQTDLLNDQTITIKEEPCYILAYLKSFLPTQSIQIEEKVEEELIDDSDNLIKCCDVKDGKENQIVALYSYEYGIDEDKVKEDIIVNISFVKDQSGKITLDFEREAGNYLYYKKILKGIKDQFAYCKA